MTQRLNLQKADPYAFQAILNIENYLATCAIPPELKSLIKLRASIINNCSFCFNMHQVEAKKTSLTNEQLTDLANWKTSLLFNDEQRAVLALTDAITLIRDGVSSDVYQTALDYLTEPLLAQCITQINLINMWNRIAITTRM
ncbi:MULTISPECIES: carboxymuconolactone decarboxylase family protein [unclassified Neptuniibacter]|uniref:carboxymuconolactone decarboxylase family protein n=1 Tax=unclassified Neptuniibacter TaxID=2630693 RepID=UPI000C43817A|nr:MULTISPECIES: carboxymuconolactone decarboxylase family protein [unclassified Neptuniibacter]MAY41888.1 hypothetical protein [Oceanospirillaceae bacterium]|tara:strand:+ start:1370 stop:1795 length:426 start_codon:yes stop_codon:yes gene_type:complete